MIWFLSVTQNWYTYSESVCKDLTGRITDVLNSFEAWKTMGKPQQITDEQYKRLEQAGQLQLYTSPEWKKINKGDIALKFDLPKQGVSFIKLSW